MMTMNLMSSKFSIKGMDCASCAIKLEDALNKNEKFESVKINFATETLFLDYDVVYSKDEIFEELTTDARRIDRQVKISEHSGSKKSKKSEHEHSQDCIHTHESHEHESREHEPHEHESREHESHEHESHEHENQDGKKMIAFILLSAVFWILAIFGNFSETVKLGFYIIAFLLAGHDVLLTAIRNVIRGQVFDENFLMSVATIGAFAIRQYSEGVAVMVLYKIGEYFQHLAISRSRKSISSLMDIRPDYANLIINGKNDYKPVPPEEIVVGSRIIIRPGEKVPLDGFILEGNSVMDTSALTGESMPQEVTIGSQVLSGSINKTGLLIVETTKEFGDSTVSKILDLVENASNKKAKAENFISKFSKIYTPIVCLLALAVAIVPPLILSQPFADWVYKALVFLVISCPCALVISIPLSFFGGIGASSKMGILVKGANYLEALNAVDTVVFDKTGTLTEGSFKVTKLIPANNFNCEELLGYAAIAETMSSHPIAQSIISAFGKEIDKSKISSYEEDAGFGVIVGYESRKIIAGNARLMDKFNIDFVASDALETAVYVAVDTVFAGYLLIADVIREDSKEAVQMLKKLGVSNIVMLTGDNSEIANYVAGQVDIDSYHASLLPHDKVRIVDELLEAMPENKKLVFVGDGINDAPVLARADIGFAMGGIGSDAAIEAADVVIMTDEMSKVPKAISIARYTRKIVLQNISLAFVVKLLAMTLGLFGIAQIWEAVIADVGVTLLAILNSMRILGKKDF